MRKTVEFTSTLRGKQFIVLGWAGSAEAEICFYIYSKSGMCSGNVLSIIQIPLLLSMSANSLALCTLRGRLIKVSLHVWKYSSA